MKFTTSAKDLLSALTQVSAVIPGKSAALIAYTGALLEVGEDVLSVTGTDGDTTIKVKCSVSESVPGTVLLPPRRLMKWLAALDHSSTVVVTSKGSSEVKVDPGSGPAYTFRTMQATLPTPPTNSADKVAVNFTGLEEALAAVKSSAEAVEGTGRDQVVQVVSGQFGLRLHSTDRMRLTRAELPEAGFGEASFVTRMRGLEVAARVGCTHIELDPKLRWVTFFSERTEVTTRLLDTPFPPVDAVLGSSTAHAVSLPKLEVSQCLARLACVAEESMPLLVDVDTDEVRLSMSASNVGSGTETITVPSPQPVSVQFGVNLEYLLDAVNVMTPTFKLGWTSPVAPLVVSNVGAVKVTVVIMPIRLSSE